MKIKNIILVLNLVCSVFLFCSDDFNFNENDSGSTNENSDPEQKNDDPETHDAQIHDHEPLKQKPVDSKDNDNSSVPDRQNSKNDNVASLLNGPSSTHSASQDATHLPESQAEKSSAAQASDAILGDEFDQGLQEEQSPPILSDEVALTPREAVDFVADLIKEELSDPKIKNKLSESQIKMLDSTIKTEADSYLEKLRKKLLRRAMKRFLRNIVKMIFKEIRYGQKIKDPGAVRAIFKKEYSKELKRLAAEKKKSILSKKKHKKSSSLHS